MVYISDKRIFSIFVFRFEIQARAQALIKQLQETYEQIEQNSLALSTFKFLGSQEDQAIPRRLEVNIILFFISHFNFFAIIVV